MNTISYTREDIGEIPGHGAQDYVTTHITAKLSPQIHYIEKSIAKSTIYQFLVAKSAISCSTKPKLRLLMVLSMMHSTHWNVASISSLIVSKTFRKKTQLLQSLCCANSAKLLVAFMRKISKTYCSETFFRSNFML